MVNSKFQFKSLIDAENSEVFKSGEYFRFYKNMDNGIYIIELVDFGTCLSHHDLIKIGNLLKN